ncbi:uncharacterized protein LOC105026257 isoform X1 [Esox lucius]|uniref:uncharacterized protein LOC105026257 isoform X1 n=2 Tax=Esox lucius TaxID=8010 RepID=UPI001476F783|nr:uncharacterized protein LOC105026257 isoform X1 [Esox lucius]
MKSKNRMEENISDSETKNSGGPCWTMERMERSDTRGLGAGVEVLREELEEGGLEQVGGCPCEEVDVPHNEEGCTSLITACQWDLTEVIHLLVTPCNHTSQTALCASPPVLQKVLLSASFRPPPHWTQLLQAAWLGDLHALQHLLAQTDLVDVNTQNRNGLTHLMLAVRDAELFEGLDNQLPWEYRPVEGVGELLALSEDLGPRDVNGYSALHYAAQIQSHIKDIIMMVESLRQPVTLDMRFFHLDDELQVTFPSPSTSLTPGFLIQSAASIEDALESSKRVPLLPHNEDNSQDKGLSLSLQSTMDNLRDTRQAYQELGMGGSGGSSLPSLWHRGRHLGKPDSTAAILKTKGGNRFPPAPPRLRGRCEVAAPPRAQLSQSAPAMTKPVLDSSCLVQARAHIQNRLRCGETEKSSYGPKVGQSIVLYLHLKC